MKVLFHPWVASRTRFVLATILVVASWHKIGDPPDFAQVIKNYHVFPAGLINPIAIYAPWLELFTGLSLFLGIDRLGGSVLAGVLMLAFAGVLSFNLARGCPTVCGCFSTFAAGKGLTDAAKFAQMQQEIALDIGFFLLALHVFVAGLRRRTCPATP